MKEKLSIDSKVEWTQEEIKLAEREEGFKVLEHELVGRNEGNWKYDALVDWEKRREILGKISPEAFEILDVKAKMTFKSASYEVWEMSESEYQRLCAVPDKTWNDNWGWWRGGNGSVMNNPTDTYTINGVEIIAFDGDRRVDNIEENETLEEDEQWTIDPKDGFASLMSYFHHELELSQPRNVTAICIDIAKLNDMRLSELFSKCHVDEQ